MDFTKNTLKFSIVIPTRDRPDTLKYTLLSCLNQDYDNFEIILCDNGTTNETKEVIDSLDNKIIKYHRSPRSLAMPDNWELAISFGTGDYFIVIGDDDALLPGSLNKINTILKTNQLKVLRWERVYYSWPSIPVKEVANKLDIPISKPIGEVLNGNNTIQGILDLEIGYTKLPMLYNSAISRELIEELKQKTGRIFSGVGPDIYSGFAFALLAKEYGSTSFPMSINAGSAKSNGVNNINLYGKNEVKTDFETLLNFSEIKWPAEVPELKSITCAIMEGFVQVMNKFPDNKPLFNYNTRKITTRIVSELKIRTKHDWEDAYLKIENSLIGKPDVLEWFRTEYKTSKPVCNVEPNYSWSPGLNTNWLFIDASEFDAYDVYTVSILCHKIIGDQFPDGVYLEKQPEKSIYQKIIKRIVDSIF